MFDSSNIAIIMSSIISIVSIISAVEIAVYQQRNQKESKAMEMYFIVQAKAYKEFYVAVSNYNDDTNEELYIRAYLKTTSCTKKGKYGIIKKNAKGAE